MLACIWRRRWLVVNLVAMATLLTLVIESQVPRRYTATSVLAIEPNRANVLRFDEVSRDLPEDDVTLQTELQTMQSAGLSERVIDRLELELRRRGRDRPSWLEKVAALDASGGSASPDAETGDRAAVERFEPMDPSQRNDLVRLFTKRLRVKLVPNTRVIEISFTNDDPRTAAIVANAVAENYIEEQLDRKYAVTRNAARVLEEQVADARLKAIAADEAVDQYRRDIGLLEGVSGALDEQQVSQLNSELVLARSELAQANARWSQLRRIVEESADNDSAFAQFDSPLLQALRAQKVELQLELDDFARRYSPNYPDVAVARAELADVKQKIDVELGKILDRARSERDVARARERSLAASLRQISNQIEAANTGEVQLRALERDAESSREILSALLTRLNEARSQANSEVQQADARMLSRAPVPDGASFPNKRIMLGLAVFVSVVIGILLALYFEWVDDTYVSGAQIREDTGLRGLALIPELPSLTFQRVEPVQHMEPKQPSPFTESFRALSAALNLSADDLDSKVVVVASANPGEGKSTTAACLSIDRARAGISVLLVDADWRRPSLNRIFNVRHEPGLTDVLEDRCKLADVVSRDKKSGVFVLPSGAGGISSELLGSRRMQQFLEEAQSSFDLIVIDTPPLMAVADAAFLGRLADQTVLVVRWNKTKRRLLSYSLELLADAGVTPAGAALTMVDVKRVSTYGYADSWHLSQDVQNYYSATPETRA